MIFSLTLSIIAIASGAVLTYVYQENEPLASRLCSGACIGFAIMGLAGFALAMFLGLNSTSLILTAVIMVTPLLLLIKARIRAGLNGDIDQALNAISRAAVHPRRWDFIYFLFYAGAAASMWLVFSRAMVEQPEGISTAVLNNFGDLPFHVSVITRFAFGQNYPPEDPTFAGVRFTYPFITDFISAMFLRAGASLRNSMFIENYIIGVAAVGVLHRFAQQLLRNRTAAILTPFLVLFNGGFGWALLFSDANKSESGIVEVLTNLPHSYTILPEINLAWRWGNSITSLLVTQRGFLLGIPLAVMVFTLWWSSLRSSEESATGKGERGKPASTIETRPPFPFTLFPLSPPAKRMIAAGAIAGLLPLIHAHSFITVMLVASFLVPWIYRRAWVTYGVGIAVLGIIFLLAVKYDVLASALIKVALAGVVIGLVVNLFFILPRQHLTMWLGFFVVAVVLALPQILWSTHRSAVKTQSFVAWQFGWDSDQETALGSKPIGSRPIGTVPPIGLWLKRLPYVSWFWLKNTGVFIPLLIIALVWKPKDYLISRKLLLFYLPFTLCFLIPNTVKLAPWVWDNIKILFYWWIASAPIVALLLAHLWEGHVGNRVMAATLFVVLTLAGALDVFFLKGNYQEFDRDGINLAETIKQTTSPGATILHAPVHNTPIYLTGRRSVIGYPGHIWTHGLDFAAREADVRQIYAGGPDAAALLAEYSVDYVVVGPQEFVAVSPNLEFFKQYQEVANIGDYHLYKVKP